MGSTSDACDPARLRSALAAATRRSVKVVLNDSISTSGPCFHPHPHRNHCPTGCWQRRHPSGTRSSGWASDTRAMTLTVPAGKNMPFVISREISETAVRPQVSLVDVFGQYTRCAAPQRFQLRMRIMHVPIDLNRRFTSLNQHFNAPINIGRENYPIDLDVSFTRLVWPIPDPRCLVVNTRARGRPS